MTPQTPRSPLVALMSLMALVWYVALALDHVAARVDAVAAWELIPEGFGAGQGAMPLWAEIAVGAAVWLGLSGAALMMVLQYRLAAHSFLTATLAAVVSVLWLRLVSEIGPQPFLGMDASQMLVAQVAVPAVLWLYARALIQRRGPR